MTESSQSSSPYVVCHATITSPAPPAGFPLPPSLECGERVPIHGEAALMECVCPRGHRFFAMHADVYHEGQ